MSPGVVPFYRPEWIFEDRREGWWNLGSIEDFWQSNKIFQIDRGYYYGLLQDDEPRVVGNSDYVGEKELDALVIHWWARWGDYKTLLAIGKNPYRYHVMSYYPYREARYVSRAYYYEYLCRSFPAFDFILRPDDLPRGSIKAIRRFTKEIRTTLEV